MAGRLLVGGVVGPMLGYPGPPHQPSMAANLHTCGSNWINGQQLQKCAECPEYHSPLRTLKRPQKLSWLLETKNTHQGSHQKAVWLNILFGFSRNDPQFPCLSDFFTNLGKEDEEIWQPAKDKYLRCVRSNSRMEKLCNSTRKFLNVEEQKQLDGWLWGAEREMGALGN